MNVALYKIKLFTTCGSSSFTCLMILLLSICSIIPLLFYYCARRKKLRFCAVVVKIIFPSISSKHRAFALFPPITCTKFMKCQSYAFFISFFSNTDVNGQVLMHFFLISKENIVLWKIWCFAQNRKFCFIFSFQLFFSSIKSISSWSVCRHVLPYFSISNFPPLKHLNDTSSFPLTKAIQSTSGTLAKYLPWRENRFSSPKTISIILFPLLLGPEPCLGGGLCPYRGACTQHRALTRTAWNQQTARRDFYLVGEQNIRWMRNWHWGKSEGRKAIDGGQQKLWWLLLVEGREEASPESWDERTGGSENPKGKSEDPAGRWAVGLSELGSRQESSPGKTKVPPQPKAAATGVTRRSCGMRGWQGSSWHGHHVHFWDLLLEPYGQSPPYPLSPLPVKSGYSGLTVALEINESKVVPAGSILQFSLWSLCEYWASFFTVTGGILPTALNAVLCKGWGGTQVPNLLKL